MRKNHQQEPPGQDGNQVSASGDPGALANPNTMAGQLGWEQAT